MDVHLNQRWFKPKTVSTKTSKQAFKLDKKARLEFNKKIQPLLTFLTSAGLLVPITEIKTCLFALIDLLYLAAFFQLL